MAKNKKEYSPSQSYLMIGAGACLVIIRFIGNNPSWSTINILKVSVGILMMGYGIFKLIKHKL